MFNEENNSKVTFALDLPALGFITWIVFLILKCTHVIDWNWFWIWFPLWIPWAVTVAFALLFGIFYLIYAIIYVQYKKRQMRRQVEELINKRGEDQ